MWGGFDALHLHSGATKREQSLGIASDQTFSQGRCEVVPLALEIGPASLIHGATTAVVLPHHGGGKPWPVHQLGERFVDLAVVAVGILVKIRIGFCDHRHYLSRDITDDFSGSPLTRRGLLGTNWATLDDRQTQRDMGQQTH